VKQLQRQLVPLAQDHVQPHPSLIVVQRIPRIAEHVARQARQLEPGM